MILRFIYKLWTLFWRTVFVFAGILSVVLLLTIGILQLPQSRECISNEAETVFNSNFEGELKIGMIDGFLPFSATVKEIRFTLPDDSLNSVLSINEASVNISWWQLLQQNLEITSFTVSEPVANVSRIDSELNIQSLFTRTSERDKRDNISGAPSSLFENLSFFVPEISVNNGSVYIDETISLPKKSGLVTPLRAENLNIDVFIEVTETQLFFELSRFETEMPGTPYNNLTMRGQFYNDSEFFELNRFEVRTDIGSADFSSRLFQSIFGQTVYKINFLEQNLALKLPGVRLARSL